MDRTSKVQQVSNSAWLLPYMEYSWHSSLAPVYMYLLYKQTFVSSLNIF